MIITVLYHIVVYTECTAITVKQKQTEELEHLSWSLVWVCMALMASRDMKLTQG